MKNVQMIFYVMLFTLHALQFAFASFSSLFIENLHENYKAFIKAFSHFHFIFNRFFTFFMYMKTFFLHRSVFRST